MLQKKPIKRSKIRLWAGNKYYTAKRFLKWYTGKTRYAEKTMEIVYPYIIFTHHTPLLRKLKDVDMKLQLNKITNLEIATAKLNKLVIKNGETFSYWKVIGKPTYKKGYLDGLILCSDGSFKSGVGGGLCQLSNLIYWMALHTPLTVTERYRHSHDIFPDINRTQPFGTGATCSYNYLDLQIHNSTNYDFQLVVYVTEKDLVGEWRSTRPSLYRYEVYEKSHSITAGLFGGYIRNNEIFRRVFNSKEECIKDEYVAENHAIMTYAPLLNTHYGK